MNILILKLIAVVAVVAVGGVAVLGYLNQKFYIFGLPETNAQVQLVTKLQTQLTQATPTDTFALTDFTPFEWQEVCLFGSGTNADKINEILGFDWLPKLSSKIPALQNIQYAVGDGSTLLVFTQGKTVLTYAETSGKIINPGATPCYFNHDAEIEATAAADLKLFKLVEPAPLKPGELPMAGKPVIYLYPPKTEMVSVDLRFTGTLTHTYPTYNDQLHGWRVIASPDGTLVDPATHDHYNYLFWEGETNTRFAPKSGFVIPGSQTLSFLKQTLRDLGLTDREANEFIVYWYPKLADNPYNFIYFAGTDYTDSAPLMISPKPDSVLRVFMVSVPLTQPLTVPTQHLTPFERTGFSVVEWGGLELPPGTNTSVVLPSTTIN